MATVSEPESEGTRLGRMMASEPELTAPALVDAGREFIRRFVAYLTAGGSDCGSMVTRLEWLKFETIVGEKTYGEVLAEMEGQEWRSTVRKQRAELVGRPRLPGATGRGRTRAAAVTHDAPSRAAPGVRDLVECPSGHREEIRHCAAHGPVHLGACLRGR